MGFGALTLSVCSEIISCFGTTLLQLFVGWNYPWYWQFCIKVFVIWRQRWWIYKHRRGTYKQKHSIGKINNTSSRKNKTLKHFSLSYLGAKLHTYAVAPATGELVMHGVRRIGPFWPSAGGWMSLSARLTEDAYHARRVVGSRVAWLFTLILLILRSALCIKLSYLQNVVVDTNKKYIIIYR